MALTTDNWVGTASADWGASASNWSAGLPDSDDNVVISTAAVLTVSYSGSDSFVVHSLTLGQDFFDMSAGSLTITTTASFADGFTQTGGVLTAGGKVTVDGTGALSFGSAEGNTAFVFDGTVALANYTLGGTTSLSNEKTTNLTAGITLGDSTGVGATIDNEKGGTFAIAGDYGIAEGAATAKFVNAGTLEKTGGSGTSSIGVNLDDSGKIVVATGTIDFYGADNSFAGPISGAGTFELSGGDLASDNTIGGGTTIATAAFTISSPNTVATLGENLTYAGTFALENEAVLDLDGFGLTLSGTDTLAGSAALSGPGTLVTPRGTAISVDGFDVGGGIVWQNAETVGEVGTLQLGDATFNPAVFINETGATFEFAADVGITTGAALDSGFVNTAGATLEKTAGANTSTIDAAVTDDGSVVVETGTIEFAGYSNSFAGAISGDGGVALGLGSNSVIAAGTAISTAAFTITDPYTLATLDEKLAYTGTFALQNDATLDLNDFGLTLSGTATLSYSLVVDEGTLVTTHGSTTSITFTTLGSGADWQNSGAVGATGALTIGDGSYNGDTVTNEKGGVYDLLNGGVIENGGASTSSFVNAAGATFAKTAGTGDSTVAVVFTNNGAVAVETGTIEFQNTVGGSGSFAIAAGSVLQFDAAVASGPRIDFAGTSGGELMLADAPQFGAAIHGFGGTDAIDLSDVGFAGVTLGYSGNATKGVLTVIEGVSKAELTLFGDYKLADFHASNDGSGGTLIVDPATHALLASAR
jgi:hypothetical protein